MSGAFGGRVPTLWHGTGVARRMTKRLTAGRETLVVADAALPIASLVAGETRAVRVDASSVDATTVVAIAREIAHRPPAVIVVIGGGSVLDAGKIAALAAAGEHVLDYVIGHASSAALTFVPDAPPPVDIVAVPTTLGTSSETNSVGILKNEHGHRLLVGRALTPRHAILDPYALATLAPRAVGEGVMEAFLRLAGASTSSRRSVRQHKDAVALGRALLESATRDTSSAAGRLRLARLSAATQRTAALRGPDPYSARHWYAANEVAYHLQVRKMVATAAIISAVWRRICAGDARWGDRDSLELFWRGVACGTAVPHDPASGIAALIDSWGILRAPRPTAAEIDRIATATERAWGDRHPMLRGLVADDFCDLLRDSDWSPRPVGGDRRLSTSLRGGETNGHEE